MSETPGDLRQEFWAALPDTLFIPKVIAAVRFCSLSLLERERWLGGGPKYLKVASRVFYRKSDVVAWLDQADEREEKNGRS